MESKEKKTALAKETIIALESNKNLKLENNELWTDLTLTLEKLKKSKHELNIQVQKYDSLFVSLNQQRQENVKLEEKAAYYKHKSGILKEQKNNLKQSLNQRFREIATLTQRYESISKQNKKTRAELESTKTNVDALRMKLKCALENNALLKKSDEELTLEAMKLKEENQNRFEEVAFLSRCIIDRSEPVKTEITRKGRLKIILNRLKKNIMRKNKARPHVHTELVRNAKYFDAQWYLKEYPDVKLANIDPAAHYLKFGGFEGRNPSLSFDSEAYLNNNPDVRKSGINPLVHYIKYGNKEGRQHFPLRKNGF